MMLTRVVRDGSVYSEEGVVMPSVVQVLERNARRAPEREGLVFGERRLSYAQFDAEVNRAAHALRRLGVAKGDRVGLISPNTDQFIIAYYAVLKLGAIIVPINPRLAPPELAYQLADSGAVALLFDPTVEGTVRAAREDVAVSARHYLSTRPLDDWPDLANLAAVESGEAPGIPVVAEDDAQILYTSGTTGKPKGVLLDHHRMVWVGVNITLCTGVQEGDRMVHVAPLYHAAQLMFLMVCTTMACTHIVQPAFDPPAVLRLLEAERSSIFFGVPTMFQFLLRQPDFAAYDLSALRVAMFGGAPMPPSVVRELADALPRARLYNLCGLTEGGPSGIALAGDDLLRKPGAGGKAVPNTEARVVDERMHDVVPGEVGEFVLRGETIMKGYWNKPEATAETFRDGWLLTGDLATIDEEGYITLVDRKKDMVITGGMNVYSVEVENAVQSHPGVLDCAVVGVPHPDWGETVVVVVTPKPGVEVTLAALREHCRPLIADYKIPRRLVLGEVPRNLSGKILKYQLREWLHDVAADGGRVPAPAAGS